MAEYRVTWMIEVEANTPEEAAMKARKYQEPGTEALYFTVELRATREAARKAKAEAKKAKAEAKKTRVDVDLLYLEQSSSEEG